MDPRNYSLWEGEARDRDEKKKKRNKEKFVDEFVEPGKPGTSKPK